MSNTTSIASTQAKIAGVGEGMTAIFVRRPVLAMVLSLLIIVAGLAAIAGVEVRELPAVDSPIITVTTTYSGASPETIDREVTAIIESAAGRVPGVKSISSSSSFGRSRVTVDFRESVNLDFAASDMRDAIAVMICERKATHHHSLALQLTHFSKISMPLLYS